MEEEKEARLGSISDDANADLQVRTTASEIEFVEDFLGTCCGE